MKEGIHPQYHNNVKVTCSCGNAFETGSTAKAIDVEVCSQCHPFYTGKQKLVDVAGRVDRFRQRQKESEEMQKKGKSLKKKTEKKEQKNSSNEVKLT